MLIISITTIIVTTISNVWSIWIWSICLTRSGDRHLKMSLVCMYFYVTTKHDIINPSENSFSFKLWPEAPSLFFFRNICLSSWCGSWDLCCIFVLSHLLIQVQEWQNWDTCRLTCAMHVWYLREQPAGTTWGRRRDSLSTKWKLYASVITTRHTSDVSFGLLQRLWSFFLSLSLVQRADLFLACFSSHSLDQ